MIKIILSTALLATTLTFVGCNTVQTVEKEQGLVLLQSNVWNLSQIGALEVKTGPDAGKLPSIQFDQTAKRVSGSDGCNRIMGGYSLNGQQLQFTDMAATRMMCSDNMQQADDFNQALARVTGYQVYSNTLRLLDRHGNVVLTFKRVVTP
ncbi:heat shock protein HslJ [Acinetobacter calcoaceticus]|uniref:Heat shock protein HslJ n=1 Tax=Acinetobacter calcoaceticus TaxID=471 RepID=A0A4V2R226_ACICA|nr:heat shock protein HslJ [Acinetobacter calcoaceticus]